MASLNLAFTDGGNNKKPPCFVGEYNKLWIIRMQIYLKAQGEEIYDVFENCPFILTTVINNVE